jgi:hypothetical protein
MNLQKIDIFHNAFDEISNLTKTSDLELCEWDLDKPENRIFEIEGHFGLVQFEVQLMSSINKSDIIFLLEKFKNQSQKLLVTKQISSVVRKKLREEKINYLDEVGNCFIYHKDLFILIDGRKNKALKNEYSYNIFSENGVKLIFNLLTRPYLINVSQREISKKVNISLGSVSKILKGLEILNFLKKINKKEKKLINKKVLLNRWVTAYNEKIKPKYFRGKYRFINKEYNKNWENLTLPNYTYWGGEPAARLLIGFLKPQILTLYSTLDKKELLKTLKIIPDNINGNINLLELPSGFNNEKEQIHPLITYADLILSFDSRNIETAQKIYDNYVKNIIE